MSCGGGESVFDIAGGYTKTSAGRPMPALQALVVRPKSLGVQLAVSLLSPDTTYGLTAPGQQIQNYIILPNANFPPATRHLPHPQHIPNG